MSAGMNCRVAVWRWSYTTDDPSGGADPTGTFIYTDVGTFLQEQPVEQLLLQQGLETQKIFQANTYPGWHHIKEGDEIEVVAPSDFYHFGDRFRVLNARASSFNRRDPRGYIMLTMVRSEEAHAKQ